MRTIEKFLTDKKIDINRMPMVYPVIKEAITEYDKELRKHLDEFYLTRIDRIRKVTATPKKYPINESEKLQLIAHVVCEQLNVPEYKLASKVRQRHLVDARHIFGYIASYSGITQSRIGKFLGGRDHSTIHHGNTKIKQLIDINDPICDDVIKIKKKFSDHLKGLTTKFEVSE